jgi:hypothetical protein
MIFSAGELVGLFVICGKLLVGDTEGLGLGRALGRLDGLREGFIDGAMLGTTLG